MSTACQYCKDPTCSGRHSAYSIRLLEELKHGDAQHRIETKLASIIPLEKPKPSMTEETMMKYDESVVDHVVSLSRSGKLCGAILEFFNSEIADMTRNAIVSKGYGAYVTPREARMPFQPTVYVLNVLKTHIF